MATFGEDLKKAREKRKVSLEEISQQSKVGLRHLRALESDRYDMLPGGVFNKGIVRSYLRCLEVNEEPWIERFSQTPGSAGNHVAPADEWVSYAEKVTGVKPSPRGEDAVRFRWLGVTVLLVALAIGGWFTYRFAAQRWHRGSTATPASVKTE